MPTHGDFVQALSAKLAGEELVVSFDIAYAQHAWRSFCVKLAVKPANAVE